jgi:hypothetical protein
MTPRIIQQLLFYPNKAIKRERFEIKEIKSRPEHHLLHN